MSDEAATLGEGISRMVPFAGRLGMEISSATPEEVRGRLSWAEDLCTTGGVMHGGALVSLADTLGATCAFLSLPEGATTSTIESKTNFFRPVTGGHVEGLTRPLHVGESVIVVQTDLTDAEGRRVAQVTQSQAVRHPS